MKAKVFVIYYTDKYSLDGESVVLTSYADRRAAELRVKRLEKQQPCRRFWVHGVWLNGAEKWK